MRFLAAGREQSRARKQAGGLPSYHQIQSKGSRQNVNLFLREP
jgi:hypothetical protein